MPSFVVTSAIALVAALVVLTFVIRARKKKPSRPVREPTGFVVLESNVWDACDVDDVREPWSRLATEPIRGFCGVSPGRHRVRTTTAHGDALIDFVIYPGEVLAWRLNVEHVRWEPHDLEATARASLETTPASSRDLATVMRGQPKVPGWLVHLRTTIGMARLRGEVLPKPDGDAVLRITKRLTKLLAKSEEDEGDDLLTEARALGDAIVGKALTRKELRALVAPARELADRHASRGHTDRAMRVVALGLAVLPGDPVMMVAAGCALAARGESDEAMRALEAALERNRCLDASDVARALRARLELRARLGRSSVRVD